MKKWVLLFFVMPIITKAAVIKWDGEAGDGLWNTATNWIGDVLPAPGDDVVLDNSIVTVSYTITLPPGAVSVVIRSLTITPQSGFSITLIIPSSNTAAPGLNVTGAGDALVINDNAILKNSSRASPGAGLTISGLLRINNGGRYIHNTQSGNAAIVSQLSTSAGTESGVFEYDVPSGGYTISLSNRTYGTLELSSLASGNTISYTGSGTLPLHIRGDLKINTKATLSISMSADVFIHRNYIQAPASVFNCQNTTSNNIIKIQGDMLVQGTITETGTGTPVVELNGATDQQITATGTIINNIILRVNNSAGVTLQTPLTLPYNLQLLNGKIRTNSINPLTMIDNAIYSGGSSLSFIDGPMKKIGDDDFIFPVGKGLIYAPIGLSGGTGASITNEFIAEYIRSNPQTAFGVNYQLSPPNNIDHISYVEYWKLSSNTGTSVSKNITLTVNCESFCKSFSSLFIVGYNAGLSQWTNKGQTANSFTAPASCPSYLTGTITAGPINEFSQLTLGSNQPYGANPLPIQLVSFNAIRLADGKTGIHWEMGSSGRGILKFEIERAGHDKNFRPFARITSNDNIFLYDYTDDQISPGTIYYRLKMTDEAGMIGYSRVVPVMTIDNRLVLLSLAPNVTSSKATLSVVSDRARAIELVIVDMQGRMIRRFHQELPAGITRLAVLFDDLSAGTYQLFGISKTAKTNVIRFVKQ